MEKKIKISNNFGPLYMPITLIGANVENKPNFFTCGWITRVERKPPIWLFSADKNRFTISGIIEHKTFSINYPTIDLVKKTDLAGMVSGSEFDKSALFDLFYGELKSAPMIKECPLCMELTLIELKELNATTLVFGELINTYSEVHYLDKNNLDIKKMKPFFLTMPDGHYRTTGSIIAKAWSVGNTIKDIE